MAWSAKTHATQLTSITSQQFFSSTPTLGLGEIAVCQVEGVFPGEDGLRIEVFSTLDASSENWDSYPFLTFIISPAQPVFSFVVRDRYKFRVGVGRDGASDTITSADLWYRTGVQL